MATVLERPVQALADATGFIVDRTLTPEKIIGQAWLISKSRVACLASTVSNYNEAPWALMVRFPHPDLAYGVKAISVHPDFNKRVAREHYLNQLYTLTPQPGIFENDIATVTLEPEIPELPADRIQELNRALSLPLQVAQGAFSNIMRAGDTGNILQAALNYGDGVLTFYDDRKIPFARIAIRQRKVLRAVYTGLTNEFAVCELMWRRPGGMYAMHAEDVAWPNIPEIQMNTDQLAAEAVRRNTELPRLLDSLGGPNACYARALPAIDFNQMPPQNRWVIERLWPALDGFLPLSKLSDRLHIDSYTAVGAVRDLKAMGALVDAGTDHFHRTGSLGMALSPGADIDLASWDTLQAFYLDEYSGAPVNATGNYFGASSLLTPRTLLHTIQLPGATHGAAIIKDQKLIGIYNGQYVSPNPQTTPPFPVSQMIWIGSLSELGAAKRLRAVESDAAMEDSGEPSGRMMAVSGRMAAVRRSSLDGEGDGGAPPEERPGAKSNEPAFLQKFTKLQVFGAGCGMLALGFLMMINSFMQPPKTMVPVVASSAKPKGEKPTADPLKAAQVAADIANFINPPIAPYQYDDTSALTAPKKSFALVSESQNQRLLFVEWPTPVHLMKKQVLQQFRTPLPFLGYPFKDIGVASKGPINKGDTPRLYYEVYNYLIPAKKDKKPPEPAHDTTCLIGVMPSTSESTCILVLAEPYNPGNLDYTTSVSIATRMFAPQYEKAQPAENPDASNPTSNTDTGSGEPEVTPEQIKEYRKSVFDSVKAVYKHPPNSEKAARCVIHANIGPDGQPKIEMKFSSSVEKVDKTLQKAILAKAPFPPPPGGKAEIDFVVEDGDIFIE